MHHPMFVLIAKRRHMRYLALWRGLHLQGWHVRRLPRRVTGSAVL